MILLENSSRLAVNRKTTSRGFVKPQNLKMRIQAADALIKAFQRAVAVASATTTTTTTNPRLPTSPLSTHVISLRTLENKPWPSTSLTPQNPILILDSSFNPPTLAHFHLALKSLHATSPSFSSLIILHAVSNADKPETDPMDLLHRVNMMFRMASDLKSNVSVIVGLTTAARFIDKAKSLRDVLFSTATSFEMPRLHWVMGYDTVTRLLHPKYYTTPTTPSTREDTVLSALAPMFDPETGANGVLVLFDRIVPAGGIGAGDTLDHYLATDPTAAKLVEMGRVKVVEGWTNLLIEKGGEVDVVLKCEVAEVDATLLEGGREAALRSLADEGSELSKRVIEAFQKCEVPSFIGNPDNDVWKQGWKSEVGVVISSGMV
ncbi:hypothetical protein BC829DRAFT_434836 [Chytridium lagenaria]|nr:hypothetical protein BC829DRAFT_434836 [Chytridium lagenaria]